MLWEENIFQTWLLLQEKYILCHTELPSKERISCMHINLRLRKLSPVPRESRLTWAGRWVAVVPEGGEACTCWLGWTGVEWREATEGGREVAEGGRECRGAEVGRGTSSSITRRSRTSLSPAITTRDGHATPRVNNTNPFLFIHDPNKQFKYLSMNQYFFPVFVWPRPYLY